ncbi:putative MFS family arabinose efflux permease [Allocatelliglobosispora scoriae]|uniref:Putative MFS family arabinose efflux permease n=1 Tax=Allocatelliglobosispora scoriae TaxID=643052 RepID=A0A841C335_9ACTN|nr:MFS transporter [Allocatelliglobosispora scoriae]MBB5873719.1 putative MFS family arabinose efflux permease [Allocatelliglobosispora scoriae]
MTASPYWPVVTHPVLRRVLPGIAVSSLGDGMSTIAVSWLALQLAPPGRGGAYVAVAAAAYTLPGAVGALLLSRFLRGRPGAQLAGWDAMLRAVALAGIPIAAAAGVLGIGLYVTLLAASSLLHSWGGAGRYTLLAEVLPREQHLAGNAVLNLLSEFATIVGPPLAALIIGWGGPAWVIAVDAATFALLAATYRFAVPGRRARPPAGTPHRAPGFRAIAADPTLLGLLAMTFGYFVLFGPVLVALPVLVGSVGELAAYFTAFGIGAVAGGLATGYLGRWRLWPTTIGVVFGFGLALLPLGLGAPLWIALGSFGLAGLIWAPYPSVSTALFQRSASVELLPSVLAARGAVMILTVPLGTAAGGPLVAALGAQATLLISGVGTTALGVLAAVLVLTRRRRPRSGPA